MKFDLVFEQTGDCIPFEVKENHALFEFFVNHVIECNQNRFFDDMEIFHSVDKKLTHLHWAVSKTNEVFYDLTGYFFKQHTDIEQYLDQDYLNWLHSEWVFAHRHTLNVDKLIASEKNKLASIGATLHDVLPDDIRDIPVLPLLEKIGYSYPFREINMGVHRLESAFSKLEFKAEEKWSVFSNPFVDSFVSNNDIVNLSFGYTYVGRQYYNKFRFFDTDLKCPDHFNYDRLEMAFQLNLSRPESIPFSKEAIAWAESRNIPLIAEQIPIANIIDLEKNLFEYRKILYRNSKAGNAAAIIFK